MSAPVSMLYALNGVFHRAGTEAVVMHYYNHLDRQRFSIDFLLHGAPGEGEEDMHQYLLDHGSRLHYVTPRGVSYGKNREELRALFAAHPYHIVHTHMNAAGTYVLSAAQQAGVRVRVAHSHNTQHQIDTGSALKNAAYRLVLDHARRSIRQKSNVRLACSRDAGDWLFGPAPYTVLHNGIQVEHFRYQEDVRLDVRQALSLSEDTLVLGHVGRFVREKNQAFLLDVLRVLLRKGVPAMLLLVGDGPLFSATKERAVELGIQQQVSFLGNREDVPRLLQAMDVFLLPSAFEGLGIAAVEAQTAGLPTLVADSVPGEVCVSSLAATLPLSSGEDAWAQAILSLSHQHPQRKDMVDAIRCAGYGVEENVRQLAAIYEAALQREGCMHHG